MEEGILVEWINWFTWILLFAYVLLIAAYTIGWLRMDYFHPDEENGSTTYFGFTILIPARNEEILIGKCLQDIADQHYPADKFEIIVLDDHSTDDTSKIVNAFVQRTGMQVQLLDMKDSKEERKYKKAAITYGIKHAKFDYIILTDADCERGTKWLLTINSFINHKKSKLVYAPVAFKADTIFQKLQSLEFAGLVGIGGAAIELKNPNMCSAANLIFSKHVFNEVNGYSGNDGIASGDDEFLMHKIFKYYPNEVHFLLNREAIVHTSANTSLQQLADQRRRWVSKSTKYENRYITVILIGAYLFNAGILFHLIFAPMHGLMMLTIKTVVEGLFLYLVLAFLKKRRYLVYLPLAEIFHILYVLIIGIWANSGSYNWKGRNLK